MGRRRAELIAQLTGGEVVGCNAGQWDDTQTLPAEQRTDVGGVSDINGIAIGGGGGGMQWDRIVEGEGVLH
jgi:hypothetical protein